MLVCADLLLKGYAVFRAVSPACSCDLIVLKDGKLCRVEVTTGHRRDNGKVNCPLKTPGAYDVLAIVVDDGKEIVYEPNFF